jgi:hypothetical protein
VGTWKRLLWLIDNVGRIQTVIAMIGLIGGSTVLAVVVAALVTMSKDSRLALGCGFFVLFLSAVTLYLLARPGRRPLIVVPVPANSGFIPPQPVAAGVTTFASLAVLLALTNPASNRSDITIVNAALEEGHLKGSKVKMDLSRSNGTFHDDNGQQPIVPRGETKPASFTVTFPWSPLDVEDRRVFVVKVMLQDQFGQKYRTSVNCPRRP